MKLSREYSVRLASGVIPVVVSFITFSDNVKEKARNIIMLNFGLLAGYGWLRIVLYMSLAFS